MDISEEWKKLLGPISSFINQSMAKCGWFFVKLIASKFVIR